MNWNLIVWWSLNNSKIPHQERNIFTVFWKLIMFLKGIRECSLDLTLCLFPITFTDIDKKFTKFLSTTDPVDTRHKLNVHKTFRKRPGSLLNVLCTFNYVLYLLEEYHCDVYSSLVLIAKRFNPLLTLCDMLLTTFHICLYQPYLLRVLFRMACLMIVTAFRPFHQEG